VVVCGVSAGGKLALNWALLRRSREKARHATSVRGNVKIFNIKYV
jgi:acetyl esterase/lipase